MTGSVDFYLKENGSANQCLLLACKVTAKALDSGYTVLVLAEDSQQAHALDDLLWTFNQGSFIPHALDTEGEDEPVIIATDQASADRFTAVINLAARALPPAFHHMRIADIIGHSENHKAEARDRFRYYRSQGMEPGMHRL